MRSLQAGSAECRAGKDSALDKFCVLDGSLYLRLMLVTTTKKRLLYEKYRSIDTGIA